MSKICKGAYPKTNPAATKKDIASVVKASAAFFTISLKITTFFKFNYLVIVKI